MLEEGNKMKCTHAEMHKKYIQHSPQPTTEIMMRRRRRKDDEDIHTEISSMQASRIYSIFVLMKMMRTRDKEKNTDDDVHVMKVR